MTDKIKILILEDNESDADLIQRELKLSGFDFTALVVDKEKDFVKELESFKPEIILSDYALPSFDGKKAFFIKQEKYPDVPFIIISGTIGEENAIELIKSGVTDYLLKSSLFGLGPKITRALKEVGEKKEKRVADEKLNAQYKKLVEIASLQSHQVRAPVANILGLIELINFDDPSDPNNIEVIRNLKKATLMFDRVISEIVKIASSVNPKLKP